MCLVGVDVRRYIDFLILHIPTPLVSSLFCSSIPTFCYLFFNVFRSLYNYIVLNKNNLYRKWIFVSKNDKNKLYKYEPTKHKQKVFSAMFTRLGMYNSVYCCKTQIDLR